MQSTHNIKTERMTEHSGLQGGGEGSIHFAMANLVAVNFAEVAKKAVGNSIIPPQKKYS